MEWLKFATPGWWPAGALVILAILSGSAAGPDTLPGDVWITLQVQHAFPHEIAGLVHAVNALGGTLGAVIATLLAAAALAWFGRLNLALLVLLTLPLRLVNSFLKVILESPRPQDGIVSVAEQQQSFGFPSGHVMGATLLYGALLLVIPMVLKPGAMRNAAYGGATAVLLLMGLSRIYVGAHWPSDVIGGYLWGAVFLVGLVGAWRWSMAVMERRGLRTPPPALPPAEPAVSISTGD